MNAIKICALSLSVWSLITLAPSADADSRHEHVREERHGRQPAKNIIFMVPDGMGLANVTATRIFMNGPDGERLNFEKLPVIGYQSTHAANSTVTDSAAAASAWATGEKYNNNEVSCHSLNGACLESPRTILEIAKQRGKATGLVATSTITHATPAAFGSHVHFRNCETEIGRQYIEETKVDILLGGGIGNNSSRAGDNCGQYPGQDKSSVITSALAGGYSYATTKAELDLAVTGRAEKILGLFNPAGLTPEYQRSSGITEPRLPEMTTAALDILEENKDGFFLMIEGSQIDWASHANDAVYQLGEMIAFDEAVAVVRQWIDAHPKRHRETLLIVVGDHETGGHAINGPYGTLNGIGDTVEAGWTSTNHTAVDTIIWSQGPGSGQLGAALDNTDLYTVMVNVLR